MSLESRLAPRVAPYGNSALSISRVFCVAYVASYILLPATKYFYPDWVGVPQLFNREAVPSAVAWAIIGLAAFGIGYWISGRFRRRRRPSTFVVCRSRLRMLWLLALAGLGTIVWFILNSYGIDTLIHHRESSFRGDGITLFSYIAMCVISSVLALLMVALRKSILVGLIQLTILTVVGFGSRGLVVTFLLAWVLVSGRQTLKEFWRRWRKYLIVAMLVAATLGLVLAREQETIRPETIIRGLVNSFEEGELFVAVHDHYRDRLLNGETILDIRYVFMPRQMFPDKPFVWGKARLEEDLSLLSIYHSDNPLYGASSVFGQLSELFANFGHLGIVAGMLLWGYVYGLVERLRNAPVDSITWFVYLAVYLLQFWVFRHGVLGLAQSLSVPAVIAPFFIAVGYGRKRSAGGTAPLFVYENSHTRPVLSA